MTQAIDAREVNSDAPQLSSSNLSRKEQTQPLNQQQHLIQTLNRFDSLDRQTLKNDNIEPVPEPGYFYQQSGKIPIDMNVSERYLQRNYTDVHSIGMNKKPGANISPIRRFQTQDQHQSQAFKLQQKDTHWKENFQSPQTNSIIKNEYNYSSNSVGDFFSRKPSSYLGDGSVRPQTQINQGASTDRYQYSSGNYSLGQDYKKYQVGSQNQTKPHTQRDGDNLTGLSSLNSSYKKITHFTGTTPDNTQLAFIRPYSTFDLRNRPESFNPNQWNRPVSYQQQTKGLKSVESARLEKNNNRNGINNLTALESQGVIEEETRYMRTYVQRPFTAYENNNQFSPITRPQKNLSHQVYQPNLSQNPSLKLQQTNVNKGKFHGAQQLIFSNISQIKRPHYENKYKEQRELRKLGGEQETKVIFKNNWVLLALLLLLLLGLISLGVWFGRNSYMDRQKYGPGYGEETITQQPGVKPTLVDPTQIKHANTTSTTNQTATNTTLPNKPIEYPPISINITILNPEIETTNDTILKPSQPTKPVVNVSVLPQQIPIVFPPIQDGESNMTNELVVAVNTTNGSVVAMNTTQNPVEKPNVVQPTKVAQGNATTNISTNVTVAKPTNMTEGSVEAAIVPVVIAEGNRTETNLTTSNTSISIQPVAIPAQVNPSIYATETSDDSVLPMMQIQFNQSYEAPIADLTYDMSVEPAAIQQDISNATTSVTAIIQPTTQPTVFAISDITNNTSQVITEPQWVIEPTTQPSMLQPANIQPSVINIQPSVYPTIIQPSVKPTQVPSFPVQPKPIAPQIPSQMTEQVEPQKVSGFQVSIMPIREDIDFQTIKNESVPFGGSIEIEPYIGDANVYITKPEKIEDLYVPSTVEINPTPMQSGYSISPIVAPIDLAPGNITVPQQNTSQPISQPQIIPTTTIVTAEPVKNITKIPQQAVILPAITPTIINPSQAPYISPSLNISGVQISIFPNVEPIQIKPQNVSTIAPIIGRQMTQPQSFVSPQSVYPAQIEPTFVQPEVVTTVDTNAINAYGDDTLTITPDIVDAYAVKPQKDINSREQLNPIVVPTQVVIKNPSQFFQLTPIVVQPTIQKPQIIQPSITEITSIQESPQITYPEIIPTTQPITSEVIQPLTIRVQILPQQTTSPQYINPISVYSNETTNKPISVSSNQSTTKPIYPSLTEIVPIEIPANLQTTYIQPSIPQFIQPSTQLPAKPIAINITQQFPAVNATQQFPAVNTTQQLPAVNTQFASVQPHTIMISQTNFSDPDELIMNRVKRLTSISSSEAIYEIPQSYDKAQLAQIEKNFLAFYNKTLQQKSPLQIIPLFWKATQDSTLFTENQYPIYYVQNATDDSESTNYLPVNFFTKPVSAQSQLKETIVQITDDGEMVVLQKGSDWAEIQKNMQTYQNSSIPASIFPNIAKHQKINPRHSLRRAD